MHIKPLLFFFTSVVYASTAFSQISITGSIKDSQQKLPLVTVLLLNLDSTMVKGTVTDQTGNFTIENVMPGFACRVEHWRAQPKVGSFRSPLFRLRSGCLVRPSPTFPAAPPKIPYGGFSPVRLQAQAPRSSVWSLPPYRSALKPDP